MKRETSRSHILNLANALPHEEPETLSSWILTQQHHRAPDAHGKLTQLLTAIAVSCKFIATAVRKVRLMWRCMGRSVSKCKAKYTAAQSTRRTSAAADIITASSPTNVSIYVHENETCKEVLWLPFHDGLTSRGDVITTSGTAAPDSGCG